LAKTNTELLRQITERKLVEKELWKKQQQLSKDLEVLDVHGSVIGAGYGQPFRQKENHLEHGDKIILYTDGVLDYPNPAGEIFGKQRFYEALQKHGRQPVQTLMDSVQMTIKDFAGPASSGDDLSMMAVEYV
jgi:sigma-B regulation protein RsbU (phosphoserine phosphatase)